MSTIVERRQRDITPYLVAYALALGKPDMRTDHELWLMTARASRLQHPPTPAPQSPPGGQAHAH